MVRVSVSTKKLMALAEKMLRFFPVVTSAFNFRPQLLVGGAQGTLVLNRQAATTIGPFRNLFGGEDGHGWHFVFGRGRSNAHHMEYATPANGHADAERISAAGASCRHVKASTRPRSPAAVTTPHA